MLFVKQECSTIQVCDNILENHVKPFAGGPAWECPGVAEQRQDLNQYSSFVLVQVFVLYLKMCVYIYIYTFYILYI